MGVGKMVHSALSTWHVQGLRDTRGDVFGARGGEAAAADCVAGMG